MRICAYVYIRTCLYARMRIPGLQETDRIVQKLHIYVYMYTYTYVYAYTWDPRDRSSCTEVAYIRAYVYVYMRIYVHTYTCICVYVYTWVPRDRSRSTDLASKYAYIRTYVYVYMRIRVYLGPKRQIEVNRPCVKVCEVCVVLKVFIHACVHEKKSFFLHEIVLKNIFQKVRVVPEVFFHACVHEKK